MNSSSQDHTPTSAPRGSQQPAHAPAHSVTCELCDGEATENDWSDTAQMIVCPRCLEETLAARQLEQQP